MPTVRGKAEVHRFIGSLPAEARKLLRGAARAAGNVIAADAKERAIDDEVAAAIKVATKAEDRHVIAKVQVKGKGAFKAPWLEYGTSPHFISVDDSQREGMSVARINRTDREARREGKIGEKESLVINGNFVGRTVFHPGARPFPFLRPALDNNEQRAFDAAQNYINARVKRSGIVATPDADGDAE